MNRPEKFDVFASTTELRQNLKRSAVRSFTSVLTTSGCEFALRVASTAILARLIAPEQFGVFLMVTAIASIADQFRDLGLSAATIQREKVAFQEVSNLFWINTLAGVALTMIVSACAPLVATYYREPRLTWLTVLFSANFAFSG